MKETNLYNILSGLTMSEKSINTRFKDYDENLSGLLDQITQIRLQMASGIFTEDDLGKLEEFKELLGVDKITEVLDAIKSQILTTEIVFSSDASVDISADQVIKYTPTGDGVVNISAEDATHYGSCIAFITLGATNAVTFNYNGSEITPLDAMIANKTNQVIIEIIGNGTTNDIQITVVRTW